MEISLKDKVIVITGGTKGLGRAVAEASIEAGGRVVISGRESSEGEEFVKFAKDKYDSKAVFVKGDLKEVENCQKLISSAIDNFGRIDGLVNYAGITTPSKITETSEQIFDDVFSINFKAAFFCSEYAVKEMIKNGGSLVHVSSTHAYGGAITRSAYGCSKGAMLVLSKHIAKNYAKCQIRSNAIIMGWSATPNELVLYESWGKNKDELNDLGKELIPMGRLQVNEDFVPGILYLLSDHSSHLTDTEFRISGGFWPSYGE